MTSTELVLNITCGLLAASLTVTSQVYTPALDMLTDDETQYVAEVATVMPFLFHWYVMVVPVGLPDTLHVKTAGLPTGAEISLPVTTGSGTTTKNQ